MAFNTVGDVIKILSEYDPNTLIFVADKNKKYEEIGIIIHETSVDLKTGEKNTLVLIK